MLLLAEGEVLLDFDVGTLRPVARLPPPFPAELPARENGKVNLVATNQALHVHVRSRSFRSGMSVRLPWDSIVSLEMVKGPKRFSRWFLEASTVKGDELQIPLLGKPRPSMIKTINECMGDPAT